MISLILALNKATWSNSNCVSYFVNIILYKSHLDLVQMQPSLYWHNFFTLKIKFLNKFQFNPKPFSLRIPATGKMVKKPSLPFPAITSLLVFVRNTFFSSHLAHKTFIFINKRWIYLIWIAGIPNLGSPCPCYNMLHLMYHWIWAKRMACALFHSCSDLRTIVRADSSETFQ